VKPEVTYDTSSGQPHDTGSTDGVLEELAQLRVKLENAHAELETQRSEFNEARVALAFAEGAERAYLRALHTAWDRVTNWEAASEAHAERAARAEAAYDDVCDELRKERRENAKLRRERDYAQTFPGFLGSFAKM